MEYTILEFLAGAALIQFLFFFVFILVQKTKDPLPNRILASLLLTKALCLTDLLLYFLKPWETYHFFAHFLYIGISFKVLWGAILYLYTKSVTNRNFRLSRWDSLHFIPFFIYFGFMWFSFIRFDLETKFHLLKVQSGAYSSYEEFIIVNSSSHILILIYLIFSFKELMQYRSEIKNNMSSIENHNLTWLMTVFIGFLILRASDITSMLVMIFTGSQSVLLMIISIALLLIFVQILVYKNLRQPLMEFGIENKKKYKDSSLTEQEKSEYTEKLEKAMKEQKPYLDPMLTLPALARMIRIQPRYLSQILNENLHQNFFDYVNRYRIEESKHLLSVNSGKEKTILAIMLAVGFNSKATFNTAFKRYTGMTPTNFLRSI